MAGILELAASGQYNRNFYETISQEYPADHSVQLEKKHHYTLDIQDGELEIYLRIEKRFMILKNTFGVPLEKTVYTGSFYELADYEANSYLYNNGKYKKVAIETYTEKMNIGNTSFYDDVKELKFTFPGLSRGSVIELITVHRILDPRMLRTVFLKSVDPVRRFEFSLETNPAIEIDLLEFNMDSVQSKIISKKTNSSEKYSLHIENIKAHVFEDNEPNIRYFTPHIIPIVRTFKTGNESKDILKDTRSLYNWYYSFLENIYTEIDTIHIHQLADSLTQNCGTESEKVMKLYEWVQKNIKYIAFEFGLGGFIPRKPDEILHNKFGDCKDKTAILHALLKTIGIPSYFTWIGTLDIPYSYNEVSSPAVDNHMILTYIDNKNEYNFLDATGKYHTFSYPTSFIQGKEALLGLGEKSYEIKKVPIVPAEKNIFSDEVTLDLFEGVIYGRGEICLSGYNKIKALYSLDNNEEKAQNKYLEQLLEKGNNKFILQNYEIAESGATDSALKIHYDFILDNYAKVNGESIYINLNIYRKWLEKKPRKGRIHPIAIEYLTISNNTYSLKIPEDYDVEFLPEDVVYENDDYSFTIDYEVNEEFISYKHKLEIHDLYITMQQMDNFRDFFEALEKAYKQTILLSKKQQ